MSDKIELTEDELERLEAARYAAHKAYARANFEETYPGLELTEVLPHMLVDGHPPVSFWGNAVANEVIAILADRQAGEVER